MKDPVEIIGNRVNEITRLAFIRTEIEKQSILRNKYGVFFQEMKHSIYGK